MCEPWNHDNGASDVWASKAYCGQAGLSQGWDLQNPNRLDNEGIFLVLGCRPQRHLVILFRSAGVSPPRCHASCYFGQQFLSWVLQPPYISQRSSEFVVSSTFLIPPYFLWGYRLSFSCKEHILLWEEKYLWPTALYLHLLFRLNYPWHTLLEGAQLLSWEWTGATSWSSFLIMHHLLKICHYFSIPNRGMWYT